MLINTKFDNRVKELRDGESAAMYLKGENLPTNTKPFFISLPYRRHLDDRKFQDEISECYLRDIEELIRIECDERRVPSMIPLVQTESQYSPRYFDRIGFHRVKSVLEQELNRRYKESARPTLIKLEDLCNQLSSERDMITGQIEETRIEVQKQKVRHFYSMTMILADSTRISAGYSILVHFYESSGKAPRGLSRWRPRVKWTDSK